MAKLRVYGVKMTPAEYEALRKRLRAAYDNPSLKFDTPSDVLRAAMHMVESFEIIVQAKHRLEREVLALRSENDALKSSENLRKGLPPYVEKVNRGKPLTADGKPSVNRGKPRVNHGKPLVNQGKPVVNHSMEKVNQSTSERLTSVNQAVDRASESGKPHEKSEFSKRIEECAEKLRRIDEELLKSAKKLNKS